jgi:hypothetical protein
MRPGAAACAIASLLVAFAAPQLAGGATGRGAAWSTVRTPNPAGAPDSVLTDVWCLTSRTCTAVGYFTGRAGTGEALIERSDGRQWTIEPTPTPAGASAALLFGVSCPTLRSCVAVGSVTGRAGITVPLIERWNGSRWSIQPTPSAAVAQFGRVSYLAGVSCASTRACVAVGHSGNSVGTTGVTIAEHWDGRRWRLVHTPGQARSKVGFLSGVSCASSIACTAVGYSAARSGIATTLAERWDGSRWALQPTPTPLTTASVQLTGVSCPALTSCVAVGFFAVTGFDVMLAERWDGSRWSIEHASYPAGARAVKLTAISCPSPTSCTAVGSFNNRVGFDVTLAERHGPGGGRWAVERPPNPAGATGSTLAGVSCWAATRCLAVGGFTDRSGTGMTLAQISS